MRLPLVCCIDGNIGAGKSTTLMELKQRGFTVFMEPKDDWQSFLSLFRIDGTRWAFALQMKILKTMIDRFREMMKTKSLTVFVERDFTSCLSFSRVALESGFMTQLEFDSFQDWFDASTISMQTDLTFRIDSSPDLCFERMKKRARPEDENVSLEYLKLVESEFEKTKTDLVINIDGTKTTSEIVQDILDALTPNLFGCNEEIGE